MSSGVKLLTIDLRVRSLVDRELLLSNGGGTARAARYRCGRPVRAVSKADLRPDSPEAAPPVRAGTKAMQLRSRRRNLPAAPAPRRAACCHATPRESIQSTGPLCGEPAF